MTTTQGSSTTYFVNNYYEVTNGVVTKYYYAGTQRIAMRKNGTLTFMVSTSSTQRLADHLCSTSLTTDSAGNVISELRYKPWGSVRYTAGTTSTKYQFTGQYSYAADFGLLYYGARFYDPQLGRFSSPDSIIPQSQGVQGYDRYAYTNNNPVRYTDPSGHELYEVSQDVWGVLQGQIGIEITHQEKIASNFAFGSAVIFGAAGAGISAGISILSGTPATPQGALLLIAGLALTGAVTSAAYEKTYEMKGGTTANDLNAVSSYLTAEANLAKALGGETSPTSFHVLILENKDGTYTVQTAGLSSNNQPVTISEDAGLYLKQIFNEGNGNVKPKLLVPESREIRKVDYE